MLSEIQHSSKPVWMINFRGTPKFSYGATPTPPPAPGTEYEFEPPNAPAWWGTSAHDIVDPKTGRLMLEF